MKATATYNAPQGDNKVVEMGGLTFFDGQPVEINSDEHPHLVNKLPGNQHFEVAMGDNGCWYPQSDGHEKPRRGRPPKEKPEEE